MKTVLFMFIIIMSLNGCHLHLKRNAIKEFLPGVYTRHYADEYTDSYDTIEIRLMTTAGSDGYTITSGTRFEKQTDEGKSIHGYQTKRWNGFYEAKTKLIWIPSTGKRIYFDPGKNELKIGTQPYKKLR
ncbi:MAG: hypothetical protein ABI237_14805 [Ginsengibacter sp.]